MKIALLTTITPYKENLHGTSGIQYHYLVCRSKDVEVVIYSYNFNNLSRQQIDQVENELHAKIVVMPKPSWIDYVVKKAAFLRIFLRYPIYNYLKIENDFLNEIKSYNPDGIWIYGQDSSRITRQFEGYNIVHTLPDSEALYYHRRLKEKIYSGFFEKLKLRIMYRKYLRQEHEYPAGPNINYHVVGQADANFLKANNPVADVHFIRHPHYELANPGKTISFSHPKIKVLIAGQNNYYMHKSAVELVGALCRNADVLREHYYFTFLGKGWDEEVDKMCAEGYEVEKITFAENYIEEIIRHDIQITPIAIGTGTKGKVLDALANGLLVIGTPYAMENIAVRSCVECLEYQNADEAITLLKEIHDNVPKYEAIALEGRNAVIREHGRELVSTRLVKLFY